MHRSDPPRGSRATRPRRRARGVRARRSNHHRTHDIEDVDLRSWRIGMRRYFYTGVPSVRLRRPAHAPLILVVDDDAPILALMRISCAVRLRSRRGQRRRRSRRHASANPRSHPRRNMPGMSGEAVARDAHGALAQPRSPSHPQRRASWTATIRSLGATGAVLKPLT
jgi:hypothetical protein